MGSLLRPSYTIPIPRNATVTGNVVQWTAKGEVKTGKLSGSGKVLCQTETWTAQFTDENGVVKRVSTKTKDKAAANRILVKLENEVNAIRAGVASREEFSRAKVAKVPVAEFLERFRIKMVANGAGNNHIKKTRRLINDLFSDCEIETLADLDRPKIELWIASERESGKRAPRTINSYLVAAKSFSAWCLENNHLAADPLKAVKKLNEAGDKRKQRRSLTEDEFRRLLESVRTRKFRKPNKREETELIYRVLVGTGLRSTELSLATPSQFDFEKNRFRVSAANTKNKKADILPIRPNLIVLLKAWGGKHNIGDNEPIFHFDKFSILKDFKKDCVRANIPHITPDGRSIDVHSLRRTFGTMLARAGVPLTTTQKLMRHSTPELTAKLYIDVEPIDMSTAIDKLPDF